MVHAGGVDGVSGCKIVTAVQHHVRTGDQLVQPYGIRAFGKAARMGPSRIARIADQLVGRREAYVVADPPVASKLASMLPAAISRLGVQNGVPQLFRPTPSLELDMHDEEQ